MSIREDVIFQAREAKQAAAELTSATTELKNRALALLADLLEEQVEEILAANEKDMEQGRKNGMSASLLDRLMLDEKRVREMAEGVRELIKLDDPVGKVTGMWKRPNGLRIGQMRVPIGVIGIIYEARPNVTVDAASLCLKAGNTVILKGGSEAYHSNQILSEVIKKALKKAELPEEAVQLIKSTDREAVRVLFELTDYLDLLIPRGGEGLIQAVIKGSQVPVIATGVGNCHIYVDKDADLEMALEIIDNAKTSRPAVCNAAESVLVHQDLAEKFLPRLFARLSAKGVEMRGCSDSLKVVPEMPRAVEDDWGREYLDYILAVKTVEDFAAAVRHINTYGSGHSEAIITRDYEKSQLFLEKVDAAAVYINASTRFTDGNQFGLGAEIGISTQKLHARGPMGLQELTSSKYIVYGQGQIRE